MAVLGFQLVLTIILLSVLNKISGKYSLARWLIAKGSLIRFKHPTDQKLREAISDFNRKNLDNTSKSVKTTSKKEKGSRKRNNKHNGSEDGIKNTFLVPQNISLELDSEPITIFHLINLPYYSDLQWLIDFSACTLFVYFTTEAYYFFLSDRASKELNLSIVWCLLSLLYSLKCLLTINGMIFRQKDERSLIISFFCAFFLLSMIVLIPNEAFLEFGLVDAYKSFNEKAIILIESTGSLDSAYGPISFLIFRFWLAVTCGLIGAFFVYPGLRMGKMQIDALQYAQNDSFGVAMKTIYHVSFLAPLFAIVLWIKPIARHYLTVREWPNRGVLMSGETFESVRLIFILTILFLRFGLFRLYLQAFLNIAPQKLTVLKKNSNKITNIDLQKQIAGVTYYFCVAALQFLAPLFIILFITLLTKSTGNYSWAGGVSQNNLQPILSVPFQSESIATEKILENLSINPSIDSETETEKLISYIENGPKDIEEILVNDSQEISHRDNIVNKSQKEETESEINKLRLELFKDVFNTTVLRGISNFGLWWLTTVWFTTSTLGFIYHNQFRTFV